MDLKNTRTEYEREELNIKDLNPSPTKQLESWLDDAKSISKYFNAATLSTVENKDQPNSRIILAKDIHEDSLVFYTNYHSAKGKQIDINSNVSILFFWPELDRQIRIQGVAEKISREDSESYFKMRPIESQISAIASQQSEEVTKEELNKRYNKIKEEDEIKCPPNWGGYIVRFKNYEFWQGRPNRLHDRLSYKQNDKLSWVITRLAP